VKQKISRSCRRVSKIVDNQNRGIGGEYNELESMLNDMVVAK